MSGSYGYWDAPDGTDCARKTFVVTRFAAALGLIGSAYDLVWFRPDTLVEAVRKGTSNTMTMAALGATFGITTCLTAQIRDAPEDPLNYLVGGCASGIFLGARVHSFGTGTVACLCLGATAFFTKIGKKEGWQFLPPLKPEVKPPPVRPPSPETTRVSEGGRSQLAAGPSCSLP